MKRIYAKVLLTVAALGLATGSAGADPVDRNYSGFGTTAHMGFGQSFKAEDGSPGLGWLVGIEPHYGFAMGTWHRLETGLELGTGYMSFKRSSPGGKVAMPIGFYGLVKAGYGYWIGENVFGVLRAGVGPAAVQYKEKIAGTEIKENASAAIWRLGYEVEIPVSDTFKMVGGAHYQGMTVNGDKFDSAYVIMPFVSGGAQLAF